MAGNQTGVRVNLAQQFRIFDRLPIEIRSVVDAAPYKYELAGIEKELRAHRINGGSLRDYRQHLIAWMCGDLMRTARKTYGQAHPDAERSRLARRGGA